MKDVIEKIIKVAVDAPSGHNYQPWKFLVKKRKIEIFNLPERDKTIFNYKQRGSYIAHGALLENIAIASSHERYRANIDFFPEKNVPDLVAVVTLKESLPAEESLYKYIPLRATNRKPYAKTPLKPEHREEILKTAREIDGAEIRLVEDSQKIDMLAGAFSLNERLILENYYVHQSLFPHILWTAQDNREKKMGLYVKTLELTFAAKMAFQLAKHWRAARFMGKLGMGKSVAAQNAKLYSSSSAIGLITTADNSKQGFVNSGRLLQRVWLTATKMGLSMQPLAALVYMGHRVIDGDTEKFSEQQVKLITEACIKISEVFDVSPQTISVPFRVGYNGQPSARAIRLAPQIQW